MRLAAATALAALVLAAAGCVQPPAAAPAGLMDVAARPAEKALLAGMRAYDDAQYADAEKHLLASLRSGLSSPKDRAAAHKHLAFIYCTSNRVAECEGAFRTARRADAQFALSKSEAGHPLWGPVYRKALP
jgi:Tfp pilus assembly protein PilF